MRANRTCPRCQSPATWYEREWDDILLRCVCGLRKLVYSKRGSVEVHHKTPRSEVRLPRKGSKLQKSLTEIVRNHPGAMNTQEVATQVGDGSAEVASRLMILCNKGLIVKVKEGRGSRGGSTWRLSQACTKLLKLVE